MDEELEISWDDQLTDKEVYYLGKIVAHWGAIEYEIFMQTLQTFGGEVEEHSELPKAMNNLRFSAVLDLWEEKVVNQKSGNVGDTLRKLLAEIKDCLDFRNTLVHSMLHWASEDIGQVIASRIKKNKYIQVKVTGDDLFEFYLKLSKVNFKLRSPGGLEELADILFRDGGGFSRRGFAMMSGHKISSDWQSSTTLNESKEE